MLFFLIIVIIRSITIWHIHGTIVKNIIEIHPSLVKYEGNLKNKSFYFFVNFAIIILIGFVTRLPLLYRKNVDNLPIFWIWIREMCLPLIFISSLILTGIYLYINIRKYGIFYYKSLISVLSFLISLFFIFLYFKIISIDQNSIIITAILSYLILITEQLGFFPINLPNHINIKLGKIRGKIWLYGGVRISGLGAGTGINSQLNRNEVGNVTDQNSNRVSGQNMSGSSKSKMGIDGKTDENPGKRSISSVNDSSNEPEKRRKIINENSSNKNEISEEKLDNVIKKVSIQEAADQIMKSVKKIEDIMPSLMMLTHAEMRNSNNEEVNSVLLDSVMYAISKKDLNENIRESMVLFGNTFSQIRFLSQYDKVKEFEENYRDVSPSKELDIYDDIGYNVQIGRFERTVACNIMSESQKYKDTYASYRYLLSMNAELAKGNETRLQDFKRSFRKATTISTSLAEVHTNVEGDIVKYPYIDDATKFKLIRELKINRQDIAKSCDRMLYFRPQIHIAWKNRYLLTYPGQNWPNMTETKEEADYYNSILRKITKDRNWPADPNTRPNKNMNDID